MTALNSQRLVCEVTSTGGACVVAGDREDFDGSKKYPLQRGEVRLPASYQKIDMRSSRLKSGRLAAY